MTATTVRTTPSADDVERLTAELITFLETGVVPPGLFADDVFGDISLPGWRLQAGDRAGLLAIRREGHPHPGRVVTHRSDATRTGFVFEFEEHWQQDGGEWLAREMFRCEVRDGRIAELIVYCTGDWSPEVIAEHAATVTLLRP